jgi:CHAD domain-containing protein
MIDTSDFTSLQSDQNLIKKLMNLSIESESDQSDQNLIKKLMNLSIESESDQSDQNLIKKLMNLSIESESDQKTLYFILKNDKFSQAQIDWTNALLFRKGSAFSI